MTKDVKTDLNIEQLHPVELDDLQGLTTDAELFLDIGGKPILYVQGPYQWSLAEIEKLHDDGFSVLFYTDQSARSFDFIQGRSFSIEKRHVELVDLFAEVFDRAVQRFQLTSDTQVMAELLAIKSQLVDFLAEQDTVREKLCELSLHDSYSFQHSVRSVVLSFVVARQLQADGAVDYFELAMGALLHDLGHLEIDSAVLEKKGQLSPLEWAAVKQHPARGLRLLESVGLSPVVQGIVLQHHERPDGRGYPHGVADEQIIPQARIVSLVDVFLALSNPRPYQKQLGIKQSLVFIESNLSEYLEEKPLKALRAVLVR